jgi:hypothetical protein
MPKIKYNIAGSVGAMIVKAGFLISHRFLSCVVPLMKKIIRVVIILCIASGLKDKTSQSCASYPLLTWTTSSKCTLMGFGHSAFRGGPINRAVLGLLHSTTGSLISTAQIFVTNFCLGSQSSLIMLGVHDFRPFKNVIDDKTVTFTNRGLTSRLRKAKDLSTTLVWKRRTGEPVNTCTIISMIMQPTKIGMCADVIWGDDVLRWIYYPLLTIRLGNWPDSTLNLFHWLALG